MTSYYSTASTKSACITLALTALISSPASAMSVIAGNHDLMTIDMVKPGRPLLHSSSISASTISAFANGKSNIVAQRRNASMYSRSENDDDVDDFRLLDMLPRELAALIVSSYTDHPSLEAAASISPSLATMGYYPTYTGGGESCSSKKSSEFNDWEDHYHTLHECCDKAFSWDYEACMNGNTVEL
ncbi:hypothetical protein ACHAXA_002173 [Cyclostephanos tholiformis]|uniref:F-box domain-containing protein n=1 Tax=Cyclostephanos tholiformis TaxID=382380 RepID=A0ABD3RVJ5_9STRA